MKFRNYCMVVMGEMGSVRDEILRVAENQPRYIDATGILISTFSSIAEPAELEDFFKSNKRTFFLFDMDKNVSGYHFDNPKINSHLFNHLVGDEINLKEMTNKLKGEVSGYTGDNIVTKKRVTTFTGKKKRQLVEMNKTERETLFNTILDKGIDNLTIYDKKILKKISEFK